MTFIIIVLCLFIEHYLLELEDYRQPAWFKRYLTWSQQLPWSEWMSQSVSGILIIVAPLLIAVGIGQAMFDDILGGIPELLFAAAVLLFSLGPRDLQRQVQSFIDACDSENEEEKKRIGYDLASGNTTQKEQTYGQTIALGILRQSYFRTFSVIFWFIILGPIGAVLYRSSYTLKQKLPEMDDLELDFRSGVNRLLYILDWVPTRITAFTYALSGNFHDATGSWWDAHEDQESDDTNNIIDRAGSGALGLESATADTDDDPATYAEMAQGLALRSLTIWVGVLAVITITNWLS
jgi:membrane protein required for beta-lactamase induction